jgi:hypothetical protein
MLGQMLFDPANDTTVPTADSPSARHGIDPGDYMHGAVPTETFLYPTMAYPAFETQVYGRGEANPIQVPAPVYAPVTYPAPYFGGQVGDGNHSAPQGHANPINPGQLPYAQVSPAQYYSSYPAPAPYVYPATGTVEDASPAAATGSHE